MRGNRGVRGCFSLCFVNQFAAGTIRVCGVRQQFGEGPPQLNPPGVRDRLVGFLDGLPMCRRFCLEIFDLGLQLFLFRVLGDPLVLHPGELGRREVVETGAAGKDVAKAHHQHGNHRQPGQRRTRRRVDDHVARHRPQDGGNRPGQKAEGAPIDAVGIRIGPVIVEHVRQDDMGRPGKDGEGDPDGRFYRITGRIHSPVRAICPSVAIQCRFM